MLVSYYCTSLGYFTFGVWVVQQFVIYYILNNFLENPVTGLCIHLVSTKSNSTV